MRKRPLVTWSLLVSAIVALVATASAQSNKTATQFYQEYVAAFAKAKAIEEILPFMAAETRKQVEETPKAERAEMFGMIKELSHTDIKVVKEETSADGKTLLSVEGVDSEKKKSTGTITLTKEGGAWKVAKESWSTKS